MFIRATTEIGGGEIHNIQRIGSGVPARDVLDWIFAVISQAIIRLRKFTDAKAVSIEIVITAEAPD
jgi:hypothetical protein